MFFKILDAVNVVIKKVKLILRINNKYYKNNNI